MEAIKTTDKDGVELQEYKGMFSLCSSREGTDGKLRPQYALYQKGRDAYQEKAWPIKVSLGDRATAIGVLRMLLSELLGPGENLHKQTNASPVAADDVPF